MVELLAEGYADYQGMEVDRLLGLAGLRVWAWTRMGFRTVQTRAGIAGLKTVEFAI